MYERILVPIDHSARSQEAARAALEIARRFKASIVALHVVAPYSPHSVGQIRSRIVRQVSAAEYDALAVTKANAALERVAALAKTARVACETRLVANADPAAVIVEQARKARADLIVMASSGRKGIERLFLGSVTREVLEKSPKQLLVCR